MSLSHHRAQRPGRGAGRSRSTSPATRNRPTACWPRSKSDSPAAAARKRLPTSAAPRFKSSPCPAEGDGKPQQTVYFIKDNCCRHRRPRRSGSDPQAVHRQSDRQLEIGQGLPGDDGKLPPRSRQARARSPLVHRAVRLHLRRPHAARSEAQQAIRTWPRFSTTTASTPSRAPAAT